MFVLLGLSATAGAGAFLLNEMARAGCRRRLNGAVEHPGGGVPPPATARLGPQSSEFRERPAEACTARCGERDAGDLQRRGPRAHAEKSSEAFEKTYAAMFPKAVAKFNEDRDELLAFHDFPAEN
ncbi:hypothetical protein [Streptomyces sp. NPDC006510]|uniref:hypothetical protein n=1 Tax=Streptomyces sp. NPDC006510 TaxID=3155600 RepID=UPI0033A586E4